MSDSVQPQRRQHSRLPRPWDSPGKNTGMGCHFLLQCMKVKSESEVSQSCPRPHGLQPTRLLRLWDFPGKSTGEGCHCLLQAQSPTGFPSKIPWGFSVPLLDLQVGKFAWVLELSHPAISSSDAPSSPSALNLFPLKTASFPVFQSCIINISCFSSLQSAVPPAVHSLYSVLFQAPLFTQNCQYFSFCLLP